MPGYRWIRIGDPPSTIALEYSRRSSTKKSMFGYLYLGQNIVSKSLANILWWRAWAYHRSFRGWFRGCKRSKIGREGLNGLKHDRTGWEWLAWHEVFIKTNFTLKEYKNNYSQAHLIQMISILAKIIAYYN